MPVKIRLTRQGRKKLPFYHIIIADSRAPRDGRFIERIGSYNPVTKPATVELNFERALYWVQKGAQPTDSCRAILSDKGVMLKKHLLEGVKKGALTVEQADIKLEAWIKDKETKQYSDKSKIEKAKADEAQKRLEIETKIKETRAEELAKRNAKLAEAESRAKTKEQADEVADEESVAEEPVTEEPVAEKPVAESEAPADEQTAEESPKAE